jgi:hypothetical protein
VAGLRKYSCPDAETQFSVYYGLTFEDRFEQQLGKIFFSVLLPPARNWSTPRSTSTTRPLCP